MTINQERRYASRLQFASALGTMILACYLMLNFGAEQARGGQEQDKELDAFKAAILERMQDPGAYTALLDYANKTGKFPQAIKCLNEILSSHPDNALAYHTLGYCYAARKDPGKAKEAWQKAVTLDPSLQGPTLKLARMYLKDGKFRPALHVLARYLAATKGKTWPVWPETAEVLIDVVQGVAEVGAKETGSITAEDRQELKALVREIIHILDLYNTPLFLPLPQEEEYRAIKPPHQRLLGAKDFADLLQSPSFVIDFYGVYGLVAVRQHDRTSADFYLRQAVALAEPGQDILRFGSAAGNLAHFLEETGEYHESGEWYRKALDAGHARLRQRDDKIARNYLANNYFNSSGLAWKQGKISDGLRQFYEAERYYRTTDEVSGADPVRSRLLLNLRFIDFYLALNDTDQAQREVDRLKDLLNRQGPIQEPDLLWAAAKCHRWQAEIHLMRGELARAEAALKEASQYTDRLPSLDQLETALLELKILAKSPGNGPRTVAKAQKLLDSIQEKEVAEQVTFRRERVETLLTAISVALSQPQAPSNEVQEWFRVLRKQLDDADPYNWKADALHLEARYYERTGNDGQAKAQYKAMAEYLAGLRVDVPIADFLYLHEQRLADAYGSYIRFLLRKERFSDALEVFEQARAQTLIRALQVQVLSTRVGGAHEDTDPATLQRLAWKRFALAKQFSESAGEPDPKVRQALDRTTDEYKLVYLRVAKKAYVAPQRVPLADLLNQVKHVPGKIVVLRADPEAGTLTTWWLSAGRLEQTATRKIDWPCLQMEVARFTEATAYGDAEVELPGGKIGYKDLADRLGETILPELKTLPDAACLTLVPDTHLQSLPFAALHLRGEPIILKKVDAIAYVPSLTALGYLEDHFGQQPPPNGLFIGVRGEGVNELTLAEEDARAMAATFEGAGRKAVALTRPEELTVEAIRAAVDGPGLVVLGTHGSLQQGNPMAGYLELPKSSRISAYDLFAWPLRGPRVVLSACEVGGDVAASNQDLLGTTMPLFAAGARAVVHAPWRVDEDVTSRLTRDLVARVARGAGLAGALVEAQRNHLRTALPFQRHPRYWAAWHVVGKGT